MSLDHLNTLYKLAVDRERAERERREAEERERQKQEMEKRKAAVYNARGQISAFNMPDGRGNPAAFSMSRPEAEAFEDMLEERL